MNLYLKYGPLAYTWNTRISHKGEKKLIGKSFLFYLFGYYFYSIGIWLFSFLYFYFANLITFLQFIRAIGLYIFLFIIFSIFYEIGYLHNDLVGKKEKNPTKRIYEDVDNRFYITQILLRILLGILGLFVTYYINPEIAKIFTIMLLVTLIIYLLHNLIRDYFYNYMTLFGLRFMKFSLILLVMYSIFGGFNPEYSLNLTLLFLLFQYFDHTILYNKRMGGSNKIPNGLGKYFYLFISCVLLFALTKSLFFVFYGILFIFLFFALTKKDDLLGKTYKR